jgi:hypothetical protein
MQDGWEIARKQLPGDTWKGLRWHGIQPGNLCIFFEYIDR